MVHSDEESSRRGPIEGFDKFTPRAISTLIGSWLIHIVVGSQYAWGNMSPYIVSYYKNLGFTWVNDSLFYAILPLIVLISMLTFPIGMYTSSIYGSRRPIIFGGVIVCSSIFVTSVVHHPYVFFIFFAGGFGIGKGFLYPAPLKASWSHLPGRKGFVSGSIVSGLGLGAFVYGIVVNLLVNPNNIMPIKTEIKTDVYEYVFPKEVTDRVPKMLLTLIACWGVQILIGVMMISNFERRPSQDDVRSENWEEIQRNRLDEQARKASLKKVVCSREFFHIYMISFTQIFYGYYIISSFKTYGQAYISDDKFLTMIGSAGALVNGVLRIFWSSMLDYFPYKKVNTVLLTIQISCILLIQFSVKNKYSYLAVVSLSMMCEGAMASMLPTLTLQNFGMIRGHDVFSYMYSSYGMSAFFGSILVSLVQYIIGFQGMLIISLAFSIISAILTYCVDENHVFNYSKLYPPSKKYIYGESFTNKFGVQVRDIGVQSDFMYGPPQQRKRPIRHHESHDLRALILGGDQTMQKIISQNFGHGHGHDLLEVHRHHPPFHHSAHRVLELKRDYGDVHYLSQVRHEESFDEINPEKEVQSHDIAGVAGSTISNKVKKQLLQLDKTRHVNLHLCTCHGKMDGSIIWGRKVHVGKKNALKILRAKSKCQRDLNMRHGFRLHGHRSKKGVVSSGNIQSEKSFFEESGHQIPQDQTQQDGGPQISKRVVDIQVTDLEQDTHKDISQTRHHNYSHSLQHLGEQSIPQECKMAGCYRPSIHAPIRHRHPRRDITTIRGHRSAHKLLSKDVVEVVILDDKNEQDITYDRLINGIIRGSNAKAKF